MKSHALLVLCLVVASAMAQTPPVIVPPGTPPAVVVTPPVTIPPLPYQDPDVRILGNVSFGPPLEPLLPLGRVRIWGPRLYPASGRCANFSFRGFVGQGEQFILGGFVVSQGSHLLMIRAVGPTLASFGVANVLLKPQLQIIDSAGRSVAVAVAWSTTSPETRAELRKAAADVGAFALREGSEDQVLLMSLAPGSYTCSVTSIGGANGVVLLEGYEVPSLSIDR